jgi:hypothetical protein
MPSLRKLLVASALLPLFAMPLASQNDKGSGMHHGTTRGLSSTPLPEPMTLTLLALGAGGVGLAAHKLRKRRKQRDD